MRRGTFSHRGERSILTPQRPMSIAGRTVCFTEARSVCSRCRLLCSRPWPAPSRSTKSKYPDLKGQWRRGPNANPVAAQGRANVFDPSKGWGPAQQPPLTPEYQARFEANLADQAAGGQGIGETYTCVSPGMPRVTNGYLQSEFVVTPNTTHILVENIRELAADFHRRARLAEQLQPSFLGYFHRQMDRYRRRRQIRRAGGRDPRLPRPARLRRQRHPPARRQSDHRQGTHAISTRTTPTRCATR